MVKSGLLLGVPNADRGKLFEEAIETTSLPNKKPLKQRLKWTKIDNKNDKKNEAEDKDNNNVIYTIIEWILVVKNSSFVKEMGSNSNVKGNKYVLVETGNYCYIQQLRKQG